MLVKLDGNTAQDVLEGFKRRLKNIPESLRKTMTYDQGSEMALHETLSAELKMDIFFCDPHSPWQRGSNENANGLVREYLPKGRVSSLTRVTRASSSSGLDVDQRSSAKVTNQCVATKSPCVTCGNDASQCRLAASENWSEGPPAGNARAKRRRHQARERFSPSK